MTLGEITFAHFERFVRDEGERMQRERLAQEQAKQDRLAALKRNREIRKRRS